MNKLLMLVLPLLLAFSGQAQAATVYGSQASKPRATPPQAISQGYQNGSLKHCADSYVITADLSNSDVIRLCRIPQGATVIDARLVFPAMSAGTFNYGYAVSDDAVEAGASTAFGSAIAVTSAGVFSMFTSNSTGTGFYKKLSAEVQTTIIVGTDTTATSGTIYEDVWYFVN